MDCACQTHYFPEPRKWAIYHCPLHAAAPEMLELLAVLACVADNDGPLAAVYRGECEKARALLAQIEGKNTK